MTSCASNVVQHTVTFEVNGGTPVNSIVIDDGNLLEVPNSTKASYTIEGWYSSINDGLTLNRKWDFISDKVLASFTLYANWIPNQVTLSFDTNGGTPIEPIIGSAGSSLIGSISTSKLGFTFAGWFADLELTQPVTIDKLPFNNAIYFAKWIVSQYTITFFTNGGNDIPIQTYFYYDFLFLSIPVRNDYEFVGWFSDINLSTLFTLVFMPAQNLNLYAKWNNEYTITFNTNGGNSIPTQTINFNATLNLPSSTKVDYSFAGWFTDVDLTQAAPTTMPAQNINLYAKWMIKWELLSSSSSAEHSTTLTSTGRVFMWGYNSNSQLGDGTTTNRNVPIEITPSFSLASGDKITSLSLGWRHSSALTSTGRVFMWGDNQYGYLGDGTSITRNVPTEITSNFSLSTGEKIISLSLGSNHASALTSTGRVFMWGGNGSGQLGDGTTTDKNVPTEITSNFSLASNDKIIALSLGVQHSSALSAMGRVFMWGYNVAGQLGDGTSTTRSIPTEITTGFSLLAGETIISISLSIDHSSALTSTGRVFMWGWNRDGQLGDGTSITRNVPTEITSNFSLPIGEKILSLSMGSSHSSAFTSTGRVFMWGYNQFGQLGNGMNVNRNLPTEITSNFSFSEGEKIISLSLGSTHSSALTSTGRVFIWGSNEYGKLGDGTNTDKNIPTEITSSFSLIAGEKIISLSLGWYHSLALTSTARVYAWGANWNNSLGDGTSSNRNVPTEITSRFSLF